MSQLTLIEVKPGIRFPQEWLVDTLGNRPKLVAKFAGLYQLNAQQISSLLRLTCPDVDLVRALIEEGGEHSGMLQDYVAELGYEFRISEGVQIEDDYEVEEDFLVELFKQAQVTVATSITEVAETLSTTLASLPGKQGRMQLKSLVKKNKKIAKKIGVHEATIEHERNPETLVVFDCSGSVGEKTVARIADAVVNLAIEANATFAIVSDNAVWWKPGEVSVSAVLDEAEYAGTHYETLSALFDKDWGVVITIADYDSSLSAKDELAKCTGQIGQLLDISLVAMPTFLAECLESRAQEVKPLLVGQYALTYAY